MTLIANDKTHTAGNTFKRISYRQFLTDSTIKPHSEWVNGEIVPMAPISNEHQFICQLLSNLMGTFVNHKRLVFVLCDPFQMKTATTLPGRAPDILSLTKSKEKRFKKNHLDGPADLVVEIISPGGQSQDRGEKFFEYEQGGVAEYWLIDPKRKQAEFYVRAKNGIFALTPVDKTGVFRSNVIKGFWIKADWLWQHPLPSEWSILKQWKLN